MWIQKQYKIIYILETIAIHSFVLPFITYEILVSWH